MKIGNGQKPVKILVEECAFEGVKRVAGKVALDIERVCGVKPDIINNVNQSDFVTVFAATAGHSEILNKLDVSEICGKRETYKIIFTERLFSESDKTLVICGSDKRGTIYGLFALSEYIGVSPLHFWGDAEPQKQDLIEIKNDIETVSKEPSVKYRGFFINDEWPCFGNWAHEKFGGINALMYEHVFELLLRLKGNYLWPAMWASSFPIDGPDCLNEELADIYGVVMGASHHEPCLRASEEWDKVKGKDSPYGNEWNYYTNRNGLLKYWEDGLKRSGKYEHIVTIGMRGERDSSMLGPDATLAQNIELLKDIITNQIKLIKENVNGDIDSVPKMLALYKEVEEYFYGNSEVAGLKDWDGLDGVTCMLCEDNFGFMRTLPTEEIRERRGGFGMYYHFDYHGGPISYEWMPSTAYSRTWEQMCMAYDYGIRDIWIVNVGDLKFNEVPLAYFMALAYDFDKYGTSTPESKDLFVKKWIADTFPAVSEANRAKMSAVLNNYIKMNAMRRPEALNADIYHPCNYLEADRMLSIASEIERANEEVYAKLSEPEKSAYYSMIYFPAKASINLLRMHLYSGKNIHYAKQGKPVANEYSALVTECIKIDNELCDEFRAFKDGKWKGMELEQHIGFVKWNDDDYRYPLRIQVEPAHKPRMAVSRKDSEYVASKNYGEPMFITVNDFMYETNTEVIIEIANGGVGAINYSIEVLGKHPEWLIVSPMKGTVKLQEEILLRCDRKKLSYETEVVRLLVKDGETTVAIDISGKATNTEGLPTCTFLENKGVIVMEANHYYSMHKVSSGQFKELCDYGRSGSGMKVFPTTASFSEKDDRPKLDYRFLIEETGEYEVEIWTTPTNSVVNKQPLRLTLNDNVLETVSSDFMAGNPGDRKWCEGVLNQIRVTKTKVLFETGIREIEIGALEAGLILERILIYQNKNKPKPSYLGPVESYKTS